MPLTREQLVGYLSDNFGVEPSLIEIDTPLFTSSLLDSFSMIEMIDYLEKETGIKFAPTQINLDNLDSVGRILSFVNGSTER